MKIQILKPSSFRIFALCCLLFFSFASLLWAAESKPARECLVVPASYNVSASAYYYCQGAAGVNILLSGSQSGVTYQLKKDGINIGSTKAGTGSALNWTNQTAGVYTIEGINGSGTTVMNGNATITERLIELNPAAATVCSNDILPLSVQTETLLHEGFNTAINNWTTENLSSGGTPANAAWTLRPTGYVSSGHLFTTNDNTQFYVSNKMEQGYYSSAHTRLVSPSLNTVGFTTLSLEMRHYFEYANPSTATIEISTNGGSSWTNYITYTSTQGSNFVFANSVFDLSAYVNYSNLKIRFVYQSSNGYWWAINDVKISGTVKAAWTPLTGLYTNATATTAYGGAARELVYAHPTTTTTYTATSSFTGCTATQSVPITVNQSPILTIANPPVGSISVDITSSSVITQNTGDALSYWKDANATIALSNPAAVSQNGTYYIKSINSLCNTIRPVRVQLDSITASQTYFCQGGNGVSIYLSGSGIGLSYQLKRNGSAIGSAIAGTGSALQWDNQTEGTYTVDIINGGNTTTMASSVSITKKLSPTITTSNSNICLGNITTLTAQPITILNEGFTNGSNWTTENTSSGYWASQVAWTVHSGYYQFSGYTFITNDNSNYYISESISDNTTTDTRLVSPVIDASGFETLYLDIWHSYAQYNCGDCYAKIQVSTDGGSSWNTVQTYTSSQGAANSFANATINLSSYANQSNLKIRFYYHAWTSFHHYWAINNVRIYGEKNSTTWSPISNLYTDASATIAYTGQVKNAVYAKPSASPSAIYTATYNYNTCTASSSTTITVNETPTLTITNPPATCVSLNLTTSSIITGNTFGGTLSYWTDVAATIPLTSPTAATESGTYHIKSTNACGNNIKPVNVIVNPLPITSFTVTSSATSYCQDNEVINVSLNGSQTDASYQLQKNGTSIGSVVQGTGNALTWANTSAAGKYNILATNGCGTVSMSSNAWVYKNPAPSVSASATSFCGGNTLTLNSLPLTLMSDNFNTTSYNWTTENLSTGGTPANSAWSYWASNQFYRTHCCNSLVKSNDNSQFYASSSLAQNSGGVTDTRLVSQTLNTYGFSNLSLEFYHCYQHYNNSSASVEVSTDGGSTWTTLQTYTATTGGMLSFASANIDLSAYVNQSSVKVRFRYQAIWGDLWMIDNIKISGTPVISWLPVTNLFTDAAATVPYVTGTNNATVYAKPTSTTTYSATANFNICSNSTPLTLTKNDPVLTIANPPDAWGSVNITSNTVIVENLNGGTLTYWRDAATTQALINPTTVTESGTYYIKSTNACSSVVASVTVSVHRLLASSTSYCEGTPGVTLSIDASESGASYQLKRDGAAIGSAIEGTGAAVEWTNQTVGVYTVDITKTGNTTAMNGTIMIKLIALSDVTPASPTICLGDVVVLNSGTITLFNENFNGATNSWTTENYTQNSNPATTWTLLPNDSWLSVFGGSYKFSSNDQSQFYSSNPTSTYNLDTRLISPLVNTSGVSQLYLDFYHYYWHYVLAGYVDISTDGGANWTILKQYTSTQGSAIAFAHETIDISAYKNQNIKIRFRYTTSYGRIWCVDNVKIIGTPSNTVWSPQTSLYSDVAATQNYTGEYLSSIYAKPLNTTNYTLTVSAFGCNFVKENQVNISFPPQLTLANASGYDTVDITSSSVILENTNGGVLSYWTNAAATIPLSNPTKISSSATYYIKSTTTYCSVIKSVEVTVFKFSTSNAYYCQGGDGVTLSLSGSEIDAMYQLKKDGLAQGDAVAGTGASLQWTNQTAGTYTLEVTKSGITSTIKANYIISEFLPSLITPTAATLCLGQSQMLTSALYLNEGFNNPTNQWTTANFSTGTNAASNAWTLRAYQYNGIYSNDNSQFYYSSGTYNSTTHTTLTSPVLNTYNYSSLKLELWHFYAHNQSSANIDISTDGGVNWTNVKSFTTSQGYSNLFTKFTLDLSAYINQSNLKIRFRFLAPGSASWGVNNVALVGNSIYNTTWAPFTGLYTDATATLAYNGEYADTVYTKPTISSIYTLTNNYPSCTTTNQVPITVNEVPVLSISDATAYGAADITSGAVITGNTFAGQLSYWKDALNTIPLAVPTTVSASGTYYIKSTNACGSDFETVNVTVYSLLASANYYCAGGLGVTLMLNNSETDAVYQLKKDGVACGEAITGTGAAMQ